MDIIVVPVDIDVVHRKSRIMWITLANIFVRGGAEAAVEVPILRPLSHLMLLLRESDFSEWEGRQAWQHHLSM